MTGEVHPSRRLIRPILIVLLLCFAIAFAVLAVRRAEADSRARFAKLPDGSKVELLGTVLGDAAFTTDTQWQRLARRFLPARLGGWLPAVFTLRAAAGSNSLAVYLRLTTPSLNAGGRPPWSFWPAEDKDGFLYPSYGGYTTSSDASTGITTCGLSISSYPRRQREFLLHLMDRGGVTLATFHVPNPVQGPFPEWRPLPLPQTMTNGPVILTLESLKENEKGAWPPLSLKFHQRATDPAWVNAEASFQTLFDATGNEGQRLSPREPAWKLRALVSRQRPEDFAANEQLVLTNLPLPAPGQFLSLDKSADCGGVGVKVLIVAGPGTFGVSNGVTRFMVPGSMGTARYSTTTQGGSVTVEKWGSYTSFLLIEARHTQPDDSILVHVRDDNGREVKVVTERDDRSPDGVRVYKPTFDPPAGTKSISITVLVNRPLSFDFLVNPAEARDGKH